MTDLEEAEDLLREATRGCPPDIVNAVAGVGYALMALARQGEDEIQGEDAAAVYWSLPWTQVGSPGHAVPRWTPVWAWHAEENDGQPFLASFVQDLADRSWFWRWSNPAPHFLKDRPEPKVSHWATMIAPEPPEVTR